jgi:hypothetical protein
MTNISSMHNRTLSCVGRDKQASINQAMQVWLVVSKQVSAQQLAGLPAVCSLLGHVISN